MSYLEAIIQGIVQGLTEFLPVSSSGHLSLTQHILGVSLESITFDIALHLGTLIAVLAVYHKLIIRLISEFFRCVKDIFKGKFSFRNMEGDRRLLVMLAVGLVPLFILFIPVPGTDMKVKDLSDMWATDANLIAEGIAFLFTSMLLFTAIILGKKGTGKKGTHFASSKARTSIMLPDAIIMGIAQCFAALLPGLSRSGSTMASGMIRGVDKQTALDYSFVLGIPTILAAAVFSIGDIGTDGLTLPIGVIIAGVVASIIVGFFAIFLFKWLVSSNKLGIFAVYTLILGIACIVISIIEANTGVNIFTNVAL
ncbi:MAG: undecaprenyl-diphosphate phosphatase [Clostridia bacterium]|nr:undecaprenyl-diphosphate phosphatase [Clostridia bacterium]